MPRKRKEEVTIEPGKGLNLDLEWIKQRVHGTLDRATINQRSAALKKAIFERAPGGAATRRGREPSRRTARTTATAPLASASRTTTTRSATSPTPPIDHTSHVLMDAAMVTVEMP